MSCQLTPAASAFSAILSALIGSVINGFASGWLVAFVTGWIAWMAIFRVLLSGIYMFYRSVTNSWGPGKKIDEAYTSIHSDAEVTGSIPMNNNNNNNNNSNPYETGYNNNSSTPYSNTPTPIYYNSQTGPNNNFTPLPPNPHNNSAALDAFTYRPRPADLTKPIVSCTDNLAAMWPAPSIVRALESATFKTPSHHPLLRTWSDLNHDVTFLGWFSWVYTTLFAPITQIIWISSNLSAHDRGAAKLVKGLTVAVTALPLCIDCKVRYGDRLPAGVLRVGFNLVTSVSVLLQGAFCGILLVTAAVDINSEGHVPFFVFIIYPVFSLVWMFISFSIVPMRDGGRKRAGQAHWAGYILDVGVGAFAGIFLAAPALMLYMNATHGGFNGSSGVSDLEEYLSCERSVLRKWAAVMP